MLYNCFDVIEILPAISYYMEMLLFIYSRRRRKRVAFIYQIQMHFSQMEAEAVFMHTCMHTQRTSLYMHIISL